MGPWDHVSTFLAMCFGQACYNSKVNCEWVLPQFFGPRVAVLNAIITPMTRWSYIMKSSQVILFFVWLSLWMVLPCFFFFSHDGASPTSAPNLTRMQVQRVTKKTRIQGWLAFFRKTSESVDWSTGKNTGKPADISWENLWYPGFGFPRNQSIDWNPEAKSQKSRLE